MRKVFKIEDNACAAHVPMAHARHRKKVLVDSDASSDDDCFKKKSKHCRKTTLESNDSSDDDGFTKKSRHHRKTTFGSDDSSDDDGFKKKSRHCKKTTFDTDDSSDDDGFKKKSKHCKKTTFDSSDDDGFNKKSKHCKKTTFDTDDSSDDDGFKTRSRFRGFEHGGLSRCEKRLFSQKHKSGCDTYATDKHRLKPIDNPHEPKHNIVFTHQDVPTKHDTLLHHDTSMHDRSLAPETGWQYLELSNFELHTKTTTNPNTDYLSYAYDTSNNPYTFDVTCNTNRTFTKKDNSISVNKIGIYKIKGICQNDISTSVPGQENNTIVQSLYVYRNKKTSLYFNTRDYDNINATTDNIIASPEDEIEFKIRFKSSDVPDDFKIRLYVKYAN
jgi:hypothetical protein